jgi:hypothetical protein
MLPLALLFHHTGTCTQKSLSLSPSSTKTHASANQHAMASSPLHHRRVVVLATLVALIGVTILLPTVQAQKLRTGPFSQNINMK